MNCIDAVREGFTSRGVNPYMSTSPNWYAYAVGKWLHPNAAHELAKVRQANCGRKADTFSIKWKDTGPCLYRVGEGEEVWPLG